MYPVIPTDQRTPPPSFHESLLGWIGKALEVQGQGAPREEPVNVRFSFSVLLAVLLPRTSWICRGLPAILYEGTTAEQNNPSAGFLLPWPGIPRASGGKAATSFGSPWQRRHEL